MYGIVFNLVEDNAALLDDVDKLLYQHGFEKSGFTNFYINHTDNMLPLFDAMGELKAFDEFKKSVTDITAFKIGQWSDFTNYIQKF